jgi:transketolase
MMEGVTSEAASLAGHLMLGNLCWMYDSNRITIEVHTYLAFGDDVAARFLAFRHTPAVPTLIIVNSHIAYGAPHTSAAHSEPSKEMHRQLID